VIAERENCGADSATYRRRNNPTLRGGSSSPQVESHGCFRANCGSFVAFIDDKPQMLNLTGRKDALEVKHFL
jgi:hypothetical protein